MTAAIMLPTISETIASHYPLGLGAQLHHSNTHSSAAGASSDFRNREGEKSDYLRELQAKLWRKEEDKERLDQEIRVLREALTIV